MPHLVSFPFDVGCTCIHTYIHIHIYIYIGVCVCVCEGMCMNEFGCASVLSHVQSMSQSMIAELGILLDWAVSF